MVNKKNNRYKIKLEEVQLKNGEEPNNSVEFVFENHDDIFEIINNIQKRNLFESKDDNIEFAVGLKLFSEVMIRNKNHPLFDEFSPNFRDFMKKLKGKS